MAFIDGEQIPDDQILDIFRSPPGVPTAYERNTLIVGSRGVGKTTLFRYLKARHAGLAIHLALGSELAAFGKEAALGPLAQNLAPEIEELIGLKATALLAISFGERLCTKNVELTGAAIAECLPTALVRPPEVLTAGWCHEARSTLSRVEIEKFGTTAGAHTLRGFLEHCGDRTSKEHGRLLLLLDRADMVVPSSLRPVMELLDQSRSYTTLVAMRPGHAAAGLTSTEIDPSIGDHSNVVYLGKAPYSTQWQSFIMDAVKAQLGDRCFDVMDPATLQHLLIMSRESLRNALELSLAVTSRGAQEQPGTALSNGVEAVRDNLSLAVQQVLQRYRMDFGRFLTAIREEVAPRAGDLQGCVRLTLRPTPSEDFFTSNDHLDHFIGSCLRARAFCIPHGSVWAPSVRVTDVEVPAIYLWKNGDPLLELGQFQQYRVTRRANEVFAVGGPITRKASVFIAYRMDMACSRTFRAAAERTIRALPSQHEITVTDGKVLPGVDWAPEIRERIKKSRILIGDVTGLRNDVIFEIGFAYGLRKVFIPVLETADHLGSIPQWLTTKQCASYESEERLLAIATSIIAHLSDPSLLRSSSRARDPVPGLAIGLWSNTVSADLSGVFSAVCAREGLSHAMIALDFNDDEQIAAATRASCLVVSLDATSGDALSHFICGAIVAKPTVGYGGKCMQRRIIITGDGNEADIRGRAADSLLRCHQNVHVVPQHAIADHLKVFGVQYRKWVGDDKATSDTTGPHNA